MPGVKEKRRYISTVREESARRTRAKVLEAAAELFVAHGYAATTVEAIAKAASVSKPTVFAAVGSKRAILKELRDISLAGDDEPVPVAQRSWYQEALNEPDPYRALALHARNVVAVSLRVADLDTVLERAAGADSELRRLWDQAERSRRTGAELVVDSLLRKGPLRPGLDRDTAVDILWVLTGTAMFQGLVHRRGWSSETYEAWLADLFRTQLLPSPEGAAPEPTRLLSGRDQ